MKKYNIGFLIAGLTLLLTSISCEKQLEIAPRQSIDATTALTSRAGVEASITASYARLKGARIYGRDLIALPEALADNGFGTGNGGRLQAEAQNNFGAHFTGTIWTNNYAAINQINLTLEAIANTNVALDQAEKNRWEGELLFLRGLYYFDLVKVYAYIPGAVITAQDRGGVVLTTKGFSTIDAALAFKPSRASTDSVYKQITDDLAAANLRLTNTGAGIGQNKANKAAAQGLLSRVHLYNKNFTEAKKWADSCIALTSSTNPNRLSDTSSYITQWRGDTHVESLFQVRYATAAENIGVNEALQTSFSTLVVRGDTTIIGGFGPLVPTYSLLNDLGITIAGPQTVANFGRNPIITGRSTDIRNLLYEKGSEGRGLSKVETTKYFGKNGVINLDNVPVIRVSEIYLTRAEAQATPGSPVFNLEGAKADLKTIKSRRYRSYVGLGISAADDALTPTQLYEEILRQRRIELAFEGQRFFDLKRLGRDMVKGPHYATLPFTDIKILPAIPNADILGNPNLKQNQGY